MLDEGILLKYKTEIDYNIEKLIKEYGLITDSEIKALIAKYKQNFIKGFKEGIEIGEARGKEERNIEIARKFLLKGTDIEDIAYITGLALAQIKELQN